MTYHLRPSDSLFLRVLTARDGGGVRAGLISGAPGVGKTALGRYFADQLGGTLEYYLCHHWSSDEDLFVRIDPARVAALAGGVAQLGVSGADVVVVVHANGYPLELQVNAQRVQRVPRLDDDAVLRFYEQLLRRYSVRAVITAADWDGDWLYRWLAEQPHIERVFWLDVYCSSYGDPRAREFPPRWLDDEGIRAWKPLAHKVRYADRCSTQHDFVDALRLLIRGRSGDKLDKLEGVSRRESLFG